MEKLALFLTTAAILVVSVCCQGSNLHCPRQNVLDPCNCNKACPNCVPVIQCRGIHGLAKLEEVFTKSGDYPLTTLEFIDLETSYIPSEQIDRKQVKQLYIINSTATTVFENSPPETSPLEVLHLYNVNLLHGIEPSKFSNLYNLRQLYITDTDVRKVNEDFGDHLPKGLQVLQLLDTRTRVVEGSAFEPLRNLLYLTIRKTRISHLKREMLPVPFKGVLLDFSYNRLKSLPSDFFTEMNDLQTVLLTGNEFSVFSKDIFGNLPMKLRTIFWRGNPMKCDCQMSWIIGKRMPYLEGKCTEPKALKDKPIRELKEADFIQC